MKHELEFKKSERPRGCIHAPYPDGCKGGVWTCSCGWEGYYEGCGNNPLAKDALDEHRELIASNERA